MTTLLESIAAVATKARKFGDRGLGEQNTKASMIEPILEALGWDIRDPEEVHREFRPKGKDNPVDYALKMMRKPRLFLEAKGLGGTLSERKWIAQVLGYAAVAGVEWCVLTDGDEYRFYNATAPIDAEEKMFCKVRLTEAVPADAAEVLRLMSRANLSENHLDALWVSHFVDRRVKASLQQMLASPNKAFVKIVNQQVPKLSPTEVADSIRRLDIRIESPPVLRPNPKKSAKSPRGASLRTPRQQQLAPGRESKVALSDLISAGTLTAPLRLFREYKGTELEATLLPDGQVSFQGKRYSSCSTAADAARVSISGRRMSTNGWEFWQYADDKGEPRTLSRARDAFLARTPLRLTPAKAAVRTA